MHKSLYIYVACMLVSVCVCVLETSMGLMTRHNIAAVTVPRLPEILYLSSKFCQSRECSGQVFVFFAPFFA